MRQITFTLYQNKTDVFGVPYTESWQQWLTVFSKHELRGSPNDYNNKERLEKNKNGPAIVLGKISEGNRRNDKNVEFIDALAIDIDNREEKEIDQFFDIINPFEYIVYTTHKHGSAFGEPRIRVILPTAEIIDPKDFKSIWLNFNVFTNEINDPSTKNPSRLNFLPSTFDLQKAWHFHNEGEWISIHKIPSSRKTDNSYIQLPDFLRRMNNDNPLKSALRNVYSGQSFAEVGHRHETILKLTYWIASIEDKLNYQDIKKLFNSSLETMRYQLEAPTIDEVWTSYTGAIEKIKAQKLEKIQSYQSQGQGQYTADELVAIAQAQNTTPDRLFDKWILQSTGGGWFLNDKGEYVGPVHKDDMATAIYIYLKRAPVRTVTLTQNSFKYRPVVDVVRECSSLVHQVVSDLTAQKTYYDTDTSTIYEAVRPYREVKPKYDPQFDRWLKIVGGSLYEKLVDWLSCCPDLSKLLCAVYFDGPPSTGKTLLAMGLAKIWTDGPPADIELILSNFNDELVRCPLILADEEIPRQYYKQNVTATLRSMISTTTRTLKRKYKPTSELKGAIRLILTANNEFLLSTKEGASAQDLEAIAQRFLYVPVPKEAADFLETLSRETKQLWADKIIAQHTMWLCENHVVEKPGKRFWIEGDVSQMHRLLITGSYWTSLCCEWLVRYLMNPRPQDSKQNGLIRIYEGELLVNEQGIIDGWSLYVKIIPQCETSKIGQALRSISKGSRRQLRWKNDRIRYRIVDVDHLISWSNQYNIGDSDVIMKRLSEGAEVISMERLKEK